MIGRATILRGQGRRVVTVQYPRLAEEEKVFLWIDIISSLSGLNVKTRHWALYASVFFVLNSIKVGQGNDAWDGSVNKIMMVVMTMMMMVGWVGGGVV
jgi:hypothetical protein